MTQASKQMHEMSLSELKKELTKIKRPKSETEKRRKQALETWIASREREHKNRRRVG